MAERSAIISPAVRDGLSDPTPPSIKTFRICTTSLCGRYYAVAEGTSIHAYKIEGDSMRLVNRVSCERAVLALSISAGPGRLALAALLENRIGIYIDSSRTGTAKGWSHWETAGTLQNTASDTASVMDFETGDVAGDVPVDNVDATSSGLASLGSGDILHQSIPTPFRQNRSVFFHDHEARLPTTHRMYQRSSSHTSFEAGAEEVSEPLWSLPKLVYKDVCTFKDQPYSVAISPSRQCVAFGCQTGVELYWVSARPSISLGYAYTSYQRSTPPQAEHSIDGSGSVAPRITCTSYLPDEAETRLIDCA